MRLLPLVYRGIALSLAAGVFACSDATGTSATDYTSLLQSLTNDVALPAHQKFAADADLLARAVADLQTAQNEDTLGKAQSAWRAARLSYRHLDALHFGPIFDLGISDRIDVAPARPTEIDPILGGTTPLDASVIAKAGGHAKGFLGVEYLIFSAKGNGAALAALQDPRRRTVAKLMADEIASSAHELDDAWSKGPNAYAKLLATAGSNARYPSQRAAVDDIVGGVGYAFEVVVAIRLAAPLGRKSGGTPDPALDPTLASDSAQADMKGTLEGISALYIGSSEARGNPQTSSGLANRVRVRSAVLADRVNGQIGDCGAKTASIPAPFGAALTTSTPSVQAAYDACKTAKLTWNTDVTSALGATLKPGDADGD